MQTTHGGGSTDAFIAKFNSERQLELSAFFGGDDADEGISVVADEENNFYVLGVTQSSQSTFPLKSSTNGNNAYDNSLGGEQDFFISRFSTNGENAWSSYFGGSGSEGQADELTAQFLPFNNTGSLGVDDCGNIYIVGSSNSEDLSVFSQITPHFWYFDALNMGQTSVSAFDGFLLVLDNDLNTEFCTYWGGAKNTNPSDLSIKDNKIIFCGYSDDTDPLMYFSLLTNNSFYSVHNNEEQDGFITLLNIGSLPLNSCTTATVEPLNNVISFINIHPNPSSGIIFLGSSLDVLHDFYTIEIFDNLGKSIFKTNSHLLTNKHQIDLGFLNSGNYHISVISNNHYFANKLIIIK